MIGHAENVVSVETIGKAFEAYRTLPGQVFIDNTLMDRAWASTIGHFIIHEFASSELPGLWSEVKPWLEQSTGSTCELVYARILKYNPTCYIPRHVDSVDVKHQNVNNLSVLIGMVPPEEYKGGELIIDNRLFELDTGDIVYYTYEHPHEVKKIKEGVRYVVNLRCKTVK
jgi:hypothetical protein